MVGCGGRCPGAAVNAMTVDPGVRLVAMTDIFADRVQNRREMLKKRTRIKFRWTTPTASPAWTVIEHVIESVDVVLIACAAKYHSVYLAGGHRGRQARVRREAARHRSGRRARVTAACELAKEKRLSIMSGLQSRYLPDFQETIKRLHDGAIGDIVAIEETFSAVPTGLFPAIRISMRSSSNSATSTTSPGSRAMT